MAHLLMFRLIIGLLYINCELVSSNTEELPSDEKAALLSGGGEMDDDELWNLLKQIGRNGSDQDPLEGFTDYEEYTLVDELYTTDVTELSSIDDKATRNMSGTEIVNTISLDFESTTGGTTISTATDSATKTENEALIETTVESVTPLDNTENSTLSEEINETRPDTSNFKSLIETSIFTPNYSTQSTIHLSSTTLQPVNVLSNSSFGSTVILSTSISTLLPEESSRINASSGPEVRSSFMERNSPITSKHGSVTTPVATSITNSVTESTIGITNNESSVVTSNVNIRSETNNQNGSFDNIDSTSLDPEKLITTYVSTSATTLAITINNVSDEFSDSSTTDANKLHGSSSEATTLPSINNNDFLLLVPAITKESQAIGEFVSNTSDLIETTTSGLSPTTLSSEVTTTYNKEYSTLLPTVSSPYITSTLTASPTMTAEPREINRLTISPKTIKIESREPMSPNNIKSTKLTDENESTVTSPFIKGTGEFSTTLSTVVSTMVSDKLSSSLAPLPELTTEKRDISNSTVSSITIITESSQPSFSKIIESDKIPDGSEITFTEPFSETKDEFSAKSPSVNSTHVSQISSSKLATKPTDATEKSEISISTVFLSSNVTDSSFSTATSTLKSIKVSDSQSIDSKLLSTPSAATASSIKNLADNLSSYTTVTTYFRTENSGTNGTTSLLDKVKTSVTEESITSNPGDVVTTVPVIKAQNTGRNTFNSRPISLSTPKSTNINVKTTKAEENSVTKQTTISTTTEFASTSGKSTPPSVANDIVTSSTTGTNKNYSTTKISNNFITVFTPLTTIKINDVTKREGDEHHTKVKSLKKAVNSLDLTTKPFKYYEVTTEKDFTSSTIAAGFNTFSKATTAKTKALATSKIEKELPSKKKILLDPSKKIFIPIEDPVIPQLNLRDHSLTTAAPQIKDTNEAFKYYEVTTEKDFTSSTIAAGFNTFSKATTAKTKALATSKIEKELPSKKKILLDPSKKIFIPIEDPVIPQLNLRDHSLTTAAPQIKDTNEALLKKTKFYPQLKTTIPSQHVILEPRGKVYLIPENKLESLDPAQKPEYMSRKHNILDPDEKIASTIVQQHSGCKHSSSRSNLDRSRIFMIDEATLTPMKIDVTPVPCCLKDLNIDKMQTEQKRPTLTHMHIPYYKSEETDVNPDMKKDVSDSKQIKVSWPDRKHLGIKSQKNLNSNKKLSFDPNRMHSLDFYPAQTAAPLSITTKKKSTLDKNRKFIIDSDDVTVTDVKPIENDNTKSPKHLSPNNKKDPYLTHPVIQITSSVVDNHHKHKNNLDQIKFSSSKQFDEEMEKKISSKRQKPQQSIPELLCFETKTKNKKPILSCIPLNGTIRMNFMHFLTNVNQHNHQQKAPILRKVVLRNQTPVATSVIVKTVPTLNKMKYTISGQVLNTGNDNIRGLPNLKASFNTPDRQVFVTNNQMQDIVRNSIIPIQRIASKQNILFLEQPPNPGSYQQIFPSTVEKNVISTRSRRSISNKCNFDGIYEDEGSSLAFVFDNTGSMNPELEQMRETAKTITKELTEKKRNLIRDYILVTFNDPEVAAPFCTNNYDEFIDALNQIRVYGGQDCPELALTGLKSTLEVSRPKSFIFVITDADAKDYHKEENIQLLIMRKSPFIFFLMTERCYGWRHQKGYDVYFNISRQTNGDIIMLDKSDVRQNSLLKKMLNSLTEDFLQQGLVPLKKITSNMPALVPYSVPISLDPAIKKVTFAVSGPQPKLDITDPKGEKPPGEPKEFPKFKSITYTEPISGVWKADIGSSSGHSFTSYGISKVQLKVGFSVIPTNKSSETSHRPLKSAENYILIEASNPDLVRNITQVDLVDLNGNFLGTVPLKKVKSANTLYFGGPFLPPDESFNTEINGFATDGSPLKRISPNAILSQLPELPYVTLQSENTVDEGTTHIIKCHVESLVPTTVKIYKKNDPPVQKVQNMKQTGDVYFELRNISIKNEGVYICSASNVAGSKLKEIKVNIRVKSPMVSVKDEVLFTLRNKVLIPCVIYSIHPYTINWKKGTSSRWTELYNSTHIQHTEKGLMIPNPKTSDEGWYQCAASSIGGDSAGTTYLKLSLPPSIEVSGLRRFYEHFNLTLTCSALRGVPAPQLKWKKNGAEFNVENGRILITHMEKYSRIDIIDANLEDEGNYECLATNFAGQDTKDLQLVYEEKPKATATVKACNIIHGGNCTLQCNISGRPLPNLIWKKDGKLLSSFSSPNIQTLLDKSLLIYNAEISDSGVYTCAAQSRIGHSEDSIVVSVTGVHPKIIEAPVDTPIEIGENGQLSCVALGTPKPKIIWKMKNKLLNRDHWEENILEINNASLSDAGVYTCIAENILGQVKSEAVVSITGGAVPILHKDKDLEFKKVLIGDKVELQCLTLGGKPRPTIEWYKDGSLLSEQPTTGIRLENGSYFISSVSTLDVGLYECIAKNEIGSDIKKIDLKFYEAPTIDLNFSSNIVATVGKPAKLFCNVSGDPPPKVTWKRHSSNFFNKTMRGIHSEDMNALVFDTVSEEDSGRYICQAENIAGIARRIFVLSVMIPPKIIPWPIETYVEVGNIVALECRVRAIPRPSLHLLKNNVTIPRSKSYGQFVRFLADPTDSGTYSCIAENNAGKDKVETNLIVLVPPQIKDITGNTVIKAISGNEAILPCDVFGNPQPSVTWHFNGELIKKQIGSEPAALSLPNVTEADAGTYICIAQNKAGENKKKMELVVLTPPRIVPWMEPLKVIIGEFVNITCQTFANPEASIAWFKDKEPLPLNSVRDKKTIGFIVQRQNQGIYTCEARNEAGMDSKDFPLLILDPPSFAKHLPFSVDVLKGNNIEIPCIAFGDPKPVMGWNRNEIILADDGRRIVDAESGKLTILNAGPEDDGYYNCTAENRAGVVWRTVEVNVQELPTASLTIRSPMVKEGDEVEFSCNVTGKPRPKIYWKKDGRILSSDNNSKLRLTLYFKDRGNYTCVAKNSAGESLSTLPIYVSVPPKIYIDKHEKVTALKGSTVSMVCPSDGVPKPDILWFFNETQLGEFNNHLFKVNGETLKMYNITPEHTGTYTCVAKNFAGWVDAKFTLYVHVKPKIINQFKNQITIQKGKDSSIPCYADGIPEPSISWKKGNKVIIHKNLSDSSVAVHNNILLLLNSDHSSEGLYTCTATNIEGEDTKEYFITVKDDKESVKEGIKEIEIVEGENGLLKCDVKPGSKVIWLKDNKTLANMPLERADDVHFVIGNRGKFLKITEAFSEDAGLYSCIAIHPDGNSTTYFSLNVKFPPYFGDAFPTLDHTVMENESITLQCAANGSPPPQVNWRLAEKNLPITDYTLPGVQIFGDNDNTLLIKSAKLFHSALYLCSASNELGTENRIFNIKVISPPQRHGPLTSEVEIMSGSKLELNCSIDGSPHPNFKWTFKSEFGEEISLQFVTRNILIGYTQAENEGLYTCFAYNLAGNSTKSFNVSVIDLPRIKRDINNTIVLAEGDDLEISCKCQGRKQASVQWFFNGVNLNESSNYIDQKFFGDFNSTQYICKLANISKENEGSYTCLMSNLAGTDELTYEVIVIAAPKMLNDDLRKLRKLECLIGSPIEIECPIESVDELKFQWKKNGVIMDGFQNKTLYIPSCAIEDEAEYICIASNIAGQLSSKFAANVLASPKLLNSYSNTTQKVVLEEKLLLNCSVSGNPSPTILWTRNMKQINNITFPQVILSENNQILEIEEVDISDSGKYSCYCSNIVGFVENHFNVEIIVPPMVKEEGKLMQKIINTDLYRRVVLRCPLPALTEPNIRWYKESEEITAGVSSMLISQDKKMLIINHPKESDAGIYKCVGSNDAGDEKFTFFLYVSIVMEWGQWSDWSDCSSSCGGGVQARTRECLGKEKEIISEYIHFMNSNCFGPDSETRPCNVHSCPINRNWSDWGDWSDCSSTCGEGLQRRTRHCNISPPLNGGDDCVGETYEYKKCEIVPCPINGNWGEWSDWSECTATCGYGLKMRTRQCSNPAPAFSGLPCSGNNRDIIVCKKLKCEENYVGWSPWSEWNLCSVTCGTGRQTRKRFCLGGVFSVACKGESHQNQRCLTEPCHKTRFPRNAELNISEKLNGLPIKEKLLAVIEENNNDTKITDVPLNITENMPKNSSATTVDKKL